MDAPRPRGARSARNANLRSVCARLEQRLWHDAQRLTLATAGFERYDKTTRRAESLSRRFRNAHHHGFCPQRFAVA